MPKRARLPYLVRAAVAEVTGMCEFARGAADPIAVAAVLSARFAVIAALPAHVLGERISPRQWAGVAAVTTGFVVITLMRICRARAVRQLNRRSPGGSGRRAAPPPS